MLPSYQDLYSPILKNADSAKNADEYLEIVAKELKLSEDDISQRHQSGEGIVRNRLRWAIHYLRRAQLINKESRGIFVITQRGKQFRTKHQEGFSNKDLSEFSEFNDFRKTSAQGPEVSDEDKIEVINNLSELTPLERLEVASKEIDQEIQRELLDRVLEQTPSFFERLIVVLLSKMGYGSERSLAQAIGKIGDGGIDGIIHQDRLGIDIVYMQAKRYARDNTIGRPELQAFVGSLAGKQSIKGVFVTTSSFSKPALEYLQTISTRVIPIDGDKLVDLMIEYEVGTRVSQTFKVTKIDEDFFLD